MVENHIKKTVERRKTRLFLFYRKVSGRRMLYENLRPEMREKRSLCKGLKSLE